eukprot:c6306_g1_i2.p1 GENE.c6306_g1_i2~~c6306_g1_i2.p1  ORF type:complete len:207 (+),score=40.39 c6306_g1_i2:47-667(+)
MRDVALGVETRPVIVEETLEIASFEYSAECISTNEFDDHFEEVMWEGCSCVGVCGLHCACGRLTNGIQYDHKHRIQNQLYQSDTMVDLPIFECHPDCRCDDDCPNRVVQHGIRYDFTVFDTQKTGFGVRAQQDLPKGVFVMEYCGERLSATEADVRINQHLQKVNRGDVSLTYLLDVRERMGHEIVRTVVDAEFVGNVARSVSEND